MISYDKRLVLVLVLVLQTGVVMSLSAINQRAQVINRTFKPSNLYFPYVPGMALWNGSLGVRSLSPTKPFTRV